MQLHVYAVSAVADALCIGGNHEQDRKTGGLAPDSHRDTDAIRCPLTCKFDKIQLKRLSG
jgi:hypothetical protein